MNMIDAKQAREQSCAKLNEIKLQHFADYPEFLRTEIESIKKAIDEAINHGYFGCRFDTRPLSKDNLNKILLFLDFYNFNCSFTRGKWYETADPKTMEQIYVYTYNLTINW